jgi:AbrB family looped-hinge helix DNA binding protein
MFNHQFYGSTTVGERGQIVIPAEARDQLKLEKGEKLLVFGLHGGTIMLTKFSSFKALSRKLHEKQEMIKKILKEK